MATSGRIPLLLPGDSSKPSSQRRSPGKRESPEPRSPCNGFAPKNFLSLRRKDKLEDKLWTKKLSRFLSRTNNESSLTRIQI